MVGGAPGGMISPAASNRSDGAGTDGILLLRCAPRNANAWPSLSKYIVSVGNTESCGLVNGFGVWERTNALTISAGVGCFAPGGAGNADVLGPTRYCIM